MNDKSKNIQIAKNTIVLYIRTLIILIVSLYTSRVVLSTLGVDDYGIYNVVGGFVTMFSLLSSSLSNAISRFITVELGKGDFNKLQKVFSTSVNVQIIIAVIIGILLEIIGIWFLNNKMQIPADRMYAANIVMQCSILTFMINLISIPYNSCIIAHERMTAFAYISIFETVLKLCCVLILYVQFSDNLIAYAIMLMLTSLIIRFVYGIFCSRNFEECHYQRKIEKPLLKEMASMASWNLLGSGANVLNNQGVNVILNLFFGVVVNAARGIAVQVNGAVIQFANNFTTALNPQITKSYAVGDYDRMKKLVFKGSRMSFFLLFIITLPILIETPIILEIWLKNVPEHSIEFVRFTLIISLISILTSSLFVVSMATGKIKIYQLIIGTLSLSTFVFTYISYKLGAKVEATYIIAIAVEFAIMFARLIIVNNLVHIGIKDFFKMVFFKVFLVVVASMIIPVFIHQVLPSSSLRLALELFICILSASISILYIGMEKTEREHVLSVVKKKIFKIQ